MFKSLHSFAKDESGATAIEYGLIAALIAVAAIGALTSVGSSLDTLFDGVASKLDAAS
ncbi:MAG: Flp family type IVb pilin [Kiloniellales bacterium]|nr:Flp family type IVb pilin [Kiloniellales bacterium]